MGVASVLPQLQMLVELLDKNQLYVNLSENAGEYCAKFEPHV